MDNQASKVDDREPSGDESEKTVQADPPGSAGHKDGLEETTYPEGGLRAWAVAMGAAGVLFSTMGYVNAFG